jgi:hypothetical protein
VSMFGGKERYVSDAMRCEVTAGLDGCTFHLHAVDLRDGG